MVQRHTIVWNVAWPGTCSALCELSSRDYGLDVPEPLDTSSFQRPSVSEKKVNTPGGRIILLHAAMGTAHSPENASDLEKEKAIPTQ